MTDYTVSVGFRGDMSGLTPDVARGTAAIDKLGQQANKASTETAAMARTTDALSLAVKAQTAAAYRATEAEQKLTAVRRAGLAGTREEVTALERYVLTQNRLVAASAKVNAAQRKSMAVGAEVAAVQRRQQSAGLGMGALTKGGLTGLAGYEVGKFAIDSVSQLQQARLSLTSLLGSQKEAGDLILQIQAFARKTPFNFTQLLGMTQQTLAMGLAPEQVMPTIKTLADTVGAMGGTSDQLGNLALTLSQIRNSGHVNAQDLRQLVESGHIDPFKLLAQANNMTRAEVADQVNRGVFKLDGQLAAQQILDGLQERFKGGAERASSTLKGQISNLYDNAQQAAAKTLTPFLPELTASVKALGDSLSFITTHDSARHLLETAAAVYGGQKAYTWATNKLVGDSARTIAANDAVALSYRKVGSAAATAAGEVGALDVAEAGGRGAGARGVLSRAGGARGLAVKTGAGLAAVAAGSLAIELARTGDRDKIRQGAAARGNWAGGGGFSDGSDRAGLVGAAHLFGGALGAVGIPGSGWIDRATGYTADMAAYQRWAQGEARRRAAAAAAAQRAFEGQFTTQLLHAEARQRSAAAANTAALSAVDAARAAQIDPSTIPQTPMFDAPPANADPAKLIDARAKLANAQARLNAALGGGGSRGPKRSSLLSAQASLASARAAQSRTGGDPTAEALRVQAAEARLNEVRGSGTRSASSQAAAEGKVATARRAVDKATRDLAKVEKNVTLDGSISLKDILSRATRTAQTSSSEVSGVRQLVKAGLSKPVIDELMALEKTAPGTIANVARGMTAAYVKQLNDDEAARTKAQSDLATLSHNAGVSDAEKAARATGAALGKATTDAYLTALKDPAWIAMARSSLSGLLMPGGTNPAVPSKAKGGTGVAALDNLFGSFTTHPTPTIPAPLVAPPPAVSSGAGRSRVNTASLQRLHPDDLAALKEAGPITINAETGASSKDIATDLGWELGKRRLA